MKRLIWVLVSALLVWNSVLTYALVKQPESVPEELDYVVDSAGQTYINNTVNGYTTDITKTVASIQPRLVTVKAVSSYDGGALQCSGVIYRAKERDCYVLTSASILSEDDRLSVQFDNSITVSAELVGKDIATDLAVVLCHPEFECVPIAIGNSEGIHQGEYVIEMSARDATLGNATASFGVVSSPLQVLREGYDEEKNCVISLILSDVQAVDFALGGPLMNLSGEMLGIVTRRTLLPDAYRRLTPAVSASEVVQVAEQLISDGAVQRSYLGMVGRNIQEMSLYEKSGAGVMLDVTEGVYITALLPNSPLAEAGIMVGDVLESINKNRISTTEDLRNFLYQEPPAVPVIVVINRSGTTVTAEVRMNKVKPEPMEEEEEETVE